MGSEGEQRWVSRAVQGSLPSQHRSLWMAPVLPGECCTLFHSPHSPLWEHPGHIPGVLLPRCPLPPHPHTLPKPLEQSPALLCPDGARQAGVAVLSLSFCLHLDLPVLFLFSSPRERSTQGVQVATVLFPGGISCVLLPGGLLVSPAHQEGRHTPASSSSSGLLLCVWQH